MRKGGGKAKGASFEREVCKQLSLWVSEGKREDLFWRSAMSGGRSTVAHRKGVDVRQSGDITAVAPEGHVLTDEWVIECKHVKDLHLGQYLIKGTGWLKEVWTKLEKEAERHNKWPMLIAKQNGWPVLFIVSGTASYSCVAPPVFGTHHIVAYFFGEVLKHGYSGHR